MAKQKSAEGFHNFNSIYFEPLSLAGWSEFQTAQIKVDFRQFTGTEKSWNIMPLGMVHGRPRRSLLFHVNTECSAHLALLSSGSIGQPMIEIELASWLNRESAIRFNETLIDQTLTQVKQSLDNTMSDDGYRLFRITFHSNNIKVFKFGQKRPFMSWENDMEQFQVTHFAFTTGCDASGEWIFYEDGTF